MQQFLLPRNHDFGVFILISDSSTTIAGNAIIFNSFQRNNLGCIVGSGGL
jgi:hypothetical protein